MFRKTLTFTYSVLMVLVGSQAALAESYLHALGTAYQEQYKEVKKLGPNASPAKIEEINRRVFAHSNELWRQQRNSFSLGMKEKSKSYWENLKQRLRTSGLLAQATAARSKQDANAPSAKEAPKAAALQKSHAPVTTGDVSDSAGAKNVEFGGARKKQDPKVVDGIIQER